MSAPVKTRTRLVRAAITDAARGLFLERGFAATTMQEISAASGIPPATVYRLMSSKVGILKALLDIAPGGDDDQIAFADRPQVRALTASTDADQAVEGFAALAGDVMGRLSPIHAILVGAAAADADAAALLAESVRQRQEGQGRFAQALERSGRLRREVTAREAADLVHALASPEVYRLLTVDRGWTRDRYVRWLADSLRAQLLAP